MDNSALQSLLSEVESLIGDDHYDEAITLLQSHLQKDPTQPILLNKLGILHSHIGDNLSAVEYFKKALISISDPVEVWYNLAIALFQIREYMECESHLLKAISVNPQHHRAHFALGSLKLSNHEYEIGWQAYEHRLGVPGKVEKLDRNFHSMFGLRFSQIQSHIWRGQNLKDKNIVVTWDQGFGDTIMFARFLPELLKQGAKVYFIPQVELASLFKMILPEVTVLDEENTKNGFNVDIDYIALIGSLPLFLQAKEPMISRGYGGFSLDSIPGGWIKNLSKPLKIGLFWSGNPDHANDRHRSISLQNLAPVFDLDADFYSLQVGGDKSVLGDFPKISDLGGEFSSFMDTARAIMDMDVVIAIDTSVIHLTGMLGKKGCVLLPYSCDWRWGREGEKSIWYDSIRLYRQQSPGEWADVVESLRNDLKAGTI